MAVVTRQIDSFNNGTVVAEYDYDSVTLLISTVRLRNTATSGTVSMTLRLTTASAPLWSASRVFQPGTFTADLRPFNQHMILVPQNDGDADLLSLPVIVGIGWAS